MFSLKSRKKQNKNERQTGKNCNTGVNVLGHGQILQLFSMVRLKFSKFGMLHQKKVPICVKHMFFCYLFIIYSYFVVFLVHKLLYVYYVNWLRVFFTESKKSCLT